MKAYVYRAALYCQECGEAIRATLDAAGKRPEHTEEESTFDSDDYPKGPYPDGGGESDYAAHCDACGAFLENPLTSHGVEHVKDAIAEFDSGHGGAPDVIETWREFYKDVLNG